MVTKTRDLRFLCSVFANSFVALTVALAASMLALPARAAPQQQAGAVTKKDEGIPRLELAPDPMVGQGRVGATQGSVGPEGVRCAVGGLSILQPVVVMLLAADAADDLTLTLYKGDWTTARRKGSTKGTGIARFEFRTEGGVNIMLRGPAKPTPYALVVWAGPELHPPMSDVVVTPEQFRKAKPVPKRKPQAPQGPGR